MKWVNATIFAKHLMMSLGLVNVIRQCFLAKEEMEIVRFDANVPETEFPASGTVASTAWFVGIDAGFEFDGAAETASVVLFCGHCIKN